MIDRIIEFSARNRFFVIMAVALATAVGIWSMRTIPLDAIPDLSDTQVIVYSKWDRSPDLVEDQVTYPIVTAMLGAPKVYTCVAASRAVLVSSDQPPTVSRQSPCSGKSGSNTRSADTRPSHAPDATEAMPRATDNRRRPCTAAPIPGRAASGRCRPPRWGEPGAAPGSYGQFRSNRTHRNRHGTARTQGPRLARKEVRQEGAQRGVAGGSSLR